MISGGEGLRERHWQMMGEELGTCLPSRCEMAVAVETKWIMQQTEKSLEECD